MAKRTNRSGSLEKHGGYWLARWMVDGKRYTRSTGCKVAGGKSARKAAEAKLKEFDHDYTLKDEKLILEKQVARLEGVEKEIEQSEAARRAVKKPVSVGGAGSTQQKKQGKSNGGTFTGDANVDTDF